MTTFTKSSASNTDNITFLDQTKYQQLIAGLSGGVCSTLILHPLDLLKIRFEVNNGLNYNLKYRSIVNGLTTIYKQEGVFGLYRGCVPNVIGAGASWGIYFYIYTALKGLQQCGDTNFPLTSSQHMIAATEAGAITALLTNPIWVCKTRLCLQSKEHLGKESYKGMLECLVKMYRAEGLRGWYRGFIPGLLGVSHGAIQFTIYEKLKNSYNINYQMPITTKLGVTEYLIFSAISKLVAVTVTYPYQVIRARLQNQFYSYRGNFDCIKNVWSNEGLGGFYKGLGTNLIRVIPSTMLTFVIYENVSHFLIPQNN